MRRAYHTLLHTRTALASGTIDRVECKQEPGEFVPVVDRSKCEGKSDCVRVCPYDVFEVRRIDEADYEALSFFPRIKVRAHGMKSSYTPRADACRTCGKCVEACPEKAIKLSRRA